MTKLVNRTVFFRVVDYGWKFWFCLFALIKYRWITWAADNLFSSRKKKKRLFYTSMDHECSSYRWGEGPSENNIIQSLLCSQNLIKNLKIRLQSEFTKHQECLIFHFRWITGPGEAKKSCWRNILNKIKFIVLLWCAHHCSPSSVSAKAPSLLHRNWE